jgi:hypothetical protein
MGRARTDAGRGRTAARAARGSAAVILLWIASSTPTRARASSADVVVSASVLPRATVTVEAHPGTLVLSETDVRRGFVDLPNASRIRVRTNSPGGYLLAFAIDSDIVAGVVLDGAGGRIQLSGGGGLVPRPYPGPLAFVSELGYRFLLSPDARPGTYPWPVALSAMPR